MSERTVAIVEPNTAKGVIINIEVVAADWVNNDPTHYLEYDAQHPAAIGWEVIDGVVQVPPPPATPPFPQQS
jgi:hypothetical protein